MFQISSVDAYNKYIHKNPIYDINSQDYLGNTILHRSVITGNVELVKIILDTDYNDIDITIKNVEGLPCIFYISKNSKEIFELFLDKIGPSIFTIFDKKGRNILFENSIRNHIYKITK